MKHARPVIAAVLLAAAVAFALWGDLFPRASTSHQGNNVIHAQQTDKPVWWPKNNVR